MKLKEKLKLCYQILTKGDEALKAIRAPEIVISKDERDSIVERMKDLNKKIKSDFPSGMLTYND